MHKGNPYPYHPTYWATRAWFYRGFVPWKLKGTMTDEGCPPWNIIPEGWTGISDPGVIELNGEAVTYEFAIDPPNAYPNLYVTLDFSIVGNERKARWRCTVGSGGVGWATGFLFQEFPQRVVYANGFEYSLPAPPYTCDDGPPLRFEPATYADGGSPWPDPEDPFQT